MSPTSSLPAPSAGPAEVRSYLTRVLISQQGLSPEAADEISHMWYLGRGSELRAASVKYFQGIFGNSNGWLLYRIVREDKLRDWRHSFVGMACSYLMFSALILSAFLVLHAVVLYAFNMPPQKGFKTVVARISQAFLFLSAALIIYGILTPSDNGTPIAIGGSMLGTFSAAATFLTTLPQAEAKA